jgi:hypothetical protein
MWVKDLLTGLYEIHKKQNASKAQKRAQEEARQEVEARLLSSGVLIEFMDRLERFEIMYLDHLADFHKRKVTSIDETEEDFLPPPPPRDFIPTMEPEAEAPAPTLRERQLQILGALRAGGK